MGDAPDTQQSTDETPDTQQSTDETPDTQQSTDETPDTQQSTDETPETQLPAESIVPWKPAGINGGANNFKQGDAIIIALELWSPTSQQFWKILEVTYAENNVFVDAEDNPYPWHRIEAWVEKDILLPNPELLRA